MTSLIRPVQTCITCKDPLRPLTIRNRFVECYPCRNLRRHAKAYAARRDAQRALGTFIGERVWAYLEGAR